MCNYKFEKASKEYSDFIFNAVLDASKDKHFNPIFYQCRNFQPIIGALKYQIQSTLENEKMPIDDDWFDSSIYIYFQDNYPCAMSWIKENEIYLFHVDKNKRREGIGKKFLKELIERLFVEKKCIFARIYINESEIFEKLAIKYGFTISNNHTGKDTRKYELSKTEYEQMKERI